MTINFLERVYSVLSDMGLADSRREFCEQWLGRQEAYIRTLRFYRCKPSVQVLALLASRLDHYANHFIETDEARSEQLGALGRHCWEDIEQRSRLSWIRAETKRSRQQRYREDDSVTNRAYHVD